MSDERVGEGIARMLNQQGPRPSNQNTLGQECEIYLNYPSDPNKHNFTKNVARAYLDKLKESNDLKDKIYKIRERHSEEMQKLELQLGKTTTEYLELSERVVNLAKERDELRLQKAALESQLAESKERCDELRIAWKVTKEQLAEARKDTERHGFYVASRATILARGQMWRALRDSGVQINASWIDEDGDGQTQSFADLWLRIEAEVKRSEALILYVEAGDFPLKGSYIEVGIALACGIPVRLVLPGITLEPRSSRPIGSWISHPLVSRHHSVREAIYAASALRAKPEAKP